MAQNHPFKCIFKVVHVAPGPAQPILAAAVFANGCRNLMILDLKIQDGCREVSGGCLFGQPRSPPPASGGSKTAFATSPNNSTLRRVKDIEITSYY